MPDSVQTLAGSSVAISAALPTTYDTDPSTGFPSLTFTAIGQVEVAPSFGRQYTLVTFLPLASRIVQKYKGSYNQGRGTITMARDDDDAGQIICLAASTSDASYSFRITYQDNTIDYFTAKVMEFPTVGGGSDTISMRNMQVEVDSAVVTA